MFIKVGQGFSIFFIYIKKLCTNKKMKIKIKDRNKAQNKIHVQNQLINRKYENKILKIDLKNTF